MANRILVLWPSGNVLCEGESALAEAKLPEVEDAPETDPCPPTQPSPSNDSEGKSGIFRRAKRAA